MISQTRGRKAIATTLLAGLVSLTLAPAALPAAAAQPQIVAPRVELLQVPLTNAVDRERFVALGLDVLSERPGAWVRVLGWPGDATALGDAGFAFEVLEHDVGRRLAVEAGSVPKVGAAPARPNAVPPFGAGSMGGYYTLAEVNAYLDSIAADDPHGIVSAVATAGTSRQGRAIRAIRLADESQPDGSRPQVLFTALTHAREPGGMQALVHFIDELLQGYGTDPNLTYLVDHREIWFVPVVNPDGYTINENTYFGSGSFGLWRKNARDNNGDGLINGSDGVDINRNFGYQWGFDNSGSSPTGSSQTYRGPSAFSEPETQSLRNFCNAHAFRTANNFHTYYEATLYPWAYNGTENPDVQAMIQIVDDMMRDAHYTYGIPLDILYAVNGDSNDWMYGEQVTKPKTYAVTTEAGDQNDGFWPSAARILPIAHQNLRSCIVLSYAAGVYVRCESAALVSDDGWLHPNGSAEVALTLRHAGLDATNGALTVTATTDAPGITITDATSAFAAMAPGTTATPAGGDRLGLEAAPTVAAGTIVPLYLEIRDAGDYVLRDTTRVTVGQPVVVFTDNGSGGLANWTSTGGWGIQTVSGNPLFSDSPAGSYAAGADARLTLNPALDLTGGQKAYLTFNTRWFLEGGFDFARVEVSTNGGSTWTAIAGSMTRPGHGTSGGYTGGTQPTGVPGYDMVKRFMAPEVLDLSAYTGLSNVRLRLRLTSDGGLQEDGWLVDDIAVLVYPEDVTDVGAAPEAGPGIEFAAASRNPFAVSTSFAATFRTPTPFRAAVYAVDGRLVRVLAHGIAAAGRRDFVWDGRDASGGTVASGTYLVRLETPATDLVRRVVRLR